MTSNKTRNHEKTRTENNVAVRQPQVQPSEKRRSSGKMKDWKIKQRLKSAGVHGIHCWFLRVAWSEELATRFEVLVIHESLFGTFKKRNKEMNVCRRNVWSLKIGKSNRGRKVDNGV